jgi:FkbM family methyltransferase
MLNYVTFSGKQIVVADVGANAGYYGLIAAAHGHRVIFIEPQPHCLIFLQAAVYLNQFK